MLTGRELGGEHGGKLGGELERELEGALVEHLWELGGTCGALSSLKMCCSLI